MAEIQNKLLTVIIIVTHSEKEVFVVKNTGNIKENLEKLSEVAPLDSTSFYCLADTVLLWLEMTLHS